MWRRQRSVRNLHLLGKSPHAVRGPSRHHVLAFHRAELGLPAAVGLGLRHGRRRHLVSGFLWNAQPTFHGYGLRSHWNDRRRIAGTVQSRLDGIRARRSRLGQMAAQSRVTRSALRSSPPLIQNALVYPAGAFSFAFPFHPFTNPERPRFLHVIRSNRAPAARRRRHGVMLPPG